MSEKNAPLTETEERQFEDITNAATPQWIQPLDDEPRAIVSALRPRASLLALDVDGMAIFDRSADATFAVRAREYVPRMFVGLRLERDRAEKAEGECKKLAAMLTKAADIIDQSADIIDDDIDGECTGAHEDAAEFREAAAAWVKP